MYTTRLLQWTRNLSCVLGAGESSQYLASDLTPDLTLAFPPRLLVSTSTAGSLKARAIPDVRPNIALLEMDSFVLYRSTAPLVDDKPVSDIEPAWSDEASRCGPAVGLGGKIGAIGTIKLRRRVTVRGKG